MSALSSVKAEAAARWRSVLQIDILMLENSTYSVISPEGAASILVERCDKAKMAAETMKITAPDLKELNIIDEIIPEIRGGAHRDPAAQSKEIDKVLKKSLKQLLSMSEEELIAQRYNKYRLIGQLSGMSEFIKIQ